LRRALIASHVSTSTSPQTRLERRARRRRHRRCLHTATLLGGKVTSLPGELREEEWTKNRSKRRVAIGPAVVELLRARRVKQAKQALAGGVSLSPDAYVFSRKADGSKPIRPTA